MTPAHLTVSPMMYTTHLLQLSVIKVFKKSVNQNLHTKKGNKSLRFDGTGPKCGFSD